MLPVFKRGVLERLLTSIPESHLSSKGLSSVLLASHAAFISTGSSGSCEATHTQPEDQPCTSNPSTAHKSSRRQRRVTKRDYLLTQKPLGSQTQLLRRHQEAASYHGGIQQHEETLRILRRYNYSLPALKGQVILARVLRVSNQLVHVDPGFHSITDLPRGDIDLSHVHQPAPGQALESRESSNDLRVGDIVYVKVDALYTPYGDMQVEAVQQDPALQKLALWRQLVAAWQAKQPVFGRVLNQCPGGYAVGISGFVALLPYARATTATTLRIGELVPFFIDQLSEQQQLLVVRDGMFKQMR